MVNKITNPPSQKDLIDKVNEVIDAKQDTLVSGTNIKTINGNSVLGSGDLSVTAQAAWGSITGTLSNQTDLQTALDAKQNTISDLESYAKLNAAQTFNGIQTFNDRQILISPKSRGDVRSIYRLSDVDVLDSSTWPTSTVWMGTDFRDKNSREMGTQYVSFYPDGSVGSYLWVKSGANSAEKMGIMQYFDGTVATFAPTPKTSDTSQKIATTAFVKNALNTWMPNYSAGVSMTGLSSSFTAPAAGVAYFDRNIGTLKVNGGYAGAQGQTYSYYSSTILLSEGDVLTWSSGRIYQGVFYPFKGA